MSPRPPRPAGGVAKRAPAGAAPPEAESSHPAPGLDAAHDPGVAPARARAERLAGTATRILTPTADIRFGTAGWTDPTLTAASVFYPDDAKTPEARLRHYASVFPLVEVDSSYYALPSRENAERWVERTPAGFTFDIKAFALMTGHPTEVKRLPKAIREALPPALREGTRVYPKDLPDEIRDEVWRWFLDAIEPLRAAGKLGAVLLQYPPWFVPTRENAAALEDARARLGDVRGAVEFRRPTWLEPRLAGRTRALLERLGLSYVSVDEPQGTEHSVPPVTMVTTPELAVVRMHGRRPDMWSRRGASVEERFRYLYDPSELKEWAPRVAAVAEAAKQVHVVFNNCYGNYGTTNALEMGAAVGAALGG